MNDGINKANIAQPQNDVMVDGELIVVVQKGDQTYDSVMDVTEEVQRLSKGKRELKLLINHTDIGKSDAGSRLAAVRSARELRASRAAFVQAPRHAQVVIKYILRIAGPVIGDWRFFTDFNEAKNWLNQKTKVGAGGETSLHN